MWNNIYPFAAVVGQPEVKQALLVAAVNPKAGGVLLIGGQGTAKSTLVRGLADIGGKGALVEVPLNATEDMVFGGMDMEAALMQGRRRVLSGLLAKADGRFLYVDEFNLLRPDMMIAIMGAASSGGFRLERDGFSCFVPTAFTLLGSCNAEEGMPSSQVLDQFGMTVIVTGEREVGQRVEIMRRCLAYEADAIRFIDMFCADSRRLEQQVTAARLRLEKMVLPNAMLMLAVQLAGQAQCQGHRAELFLIEAAKAVAALAERLYVLPDDMTAAARLVLPHRAGQAGGAGAVSDLPEQQQSADQAGQQQRTAQQADGQGTQDGALEYDSSGDGSMSDENQMPSSGNASGNGAIGDQVAAIGDTPYLGRINLQAPHRSNGSGGGKRVALRTADRKGRYIRAAHYSGAAVDLALDATLRAAAPHQRFRPPGHCAIVVYRQDWRGKVRERRVGTTFLFVVDASGSMGAAQRMQAVKATVLAMLRDAYQKRDHVGLIAFRRTQAELLLPVTRSVDLAQKHLQHLPTGGKTPLAEALMLAGRVLGRLRRKTGDVQPVLVLITDGRANGGSGDAVTMALAAARSLGEHGLYSLTIDTEQHFIKLGIARQVAASLGGAYYKLEELSAQRMIEVVGSLR